MIGFKVIDTENGEEYRHQDSVYMRYNGKLYGSQCAVKNGRFVVGLEESQFDERYKAVPSITIDGVEYYHGMVIKSVKGEIAVIYYGKSIGTVSADYTYFGWCIAENNDGNRHDCIVSKEILEGVKIVGNVWQLEFRSLLPLLEV